MGLRILPNYESGGQRFESFRARQYFQRLTLFLLLLLFRWGSTGVPSRAAMARAPWCEFASDGTRGPLSLHLRISICREAVQLGAGYEQESNAEVRTRVGRRDRS
jgi:hypothetical protein